MLRKLFVLLPIFVLFFIAIAFGAQNSELVMVDFFVLKTELTLASLSAIFIGAGFVFGLVSLGWSNWRLRLTLQRTEKQLARLTKRQQQEP